VTEAIRHYQARMRRVLDYIDAHLERDLNVEVLSAVAAFSRFHFQRQFTALFGLSPHRYVQLLRMKRASYRLAYRPGDSITEIALDSGYESPEAFSRVFRQRLGQSPGDFRKAPDWAALQDMTQSGTEIRGIFMSAKPELDQVRIIDFPHTPVAVLTHHGAPERLGDSLRNFIAWRKQMKLAPAVSATFNILHADPLNCEPEDYRIALCAATDQQVAANEFGIVADAIPAGSCAVLRHIGVNDSLRDAVAFLYTDWLPQSGKEMRDYPIFVQRVRFFPDVPEHEAVVDIFLPLK
jgi:AraC family transcriptional regulator